MRFLIAFSTKNKTRVVGHEGKDFQGLLVMITSILTQLLKVVSKEDILNCLEFAEEYTKDTKG